MIQGGIGNCYAIASAAAVAEEPDRIRDIFLTQKTNKAGILALTFYIRGKPWVITIDDELLFHYPGHGAHLIFSQPSKNGEMWGPLLEKAWSKVRGNFLNSEGGMNVNTLRSFTSAPVFSYSQVNNDSLKDLFNKMREADEKKYIMTASSHGSNDSMYNGCGVAMGHAYSVLQTFQMTKADGEVIDMMIVRNPWGKTGYSWKWHQGDPNWTQDLISQVPFGIDPTNEDMSTRHGIFFMPMEGMLPQNGCLSDIQIGHARENEGFSDNWYDKIDTEGQETQNYTFTLPQTLDEGLYITIESYYYNMIPYQCTTGYYTDMYGNMRYNWHPLLFFTVYKQVGDREE